MAARLPVSRSNRIRWQTALEDLDLDVTQTVDDERWSPALAASRHARAALTVRGMDAEAAACRPGLCSSVRCSATEGDSSELLGSAESRAITGYELLRRLAKGGMGIVYEARDANGEHVALKMINRRSRGAEASLRREVRALKRLDHPGIVRMRCEGTRRREPFFTMDLLSGPSLRLVLARGNRAPLTAMRRVASSLAFVHAQGFVHGDLTPGNILFRAPDQPVLVDFGLAAPFPIRACRGGRPGGGGIVGTLAYLAPEQIRRQRVDPRTDLYAFGCILYETLTGRVPFNGRHRATVLRQHLEAAPCPPSLLSPSIPPVLEKLTLRLLAKTPSERPESAAEIVAAFDSVGAAG